MPSRSLQFSTLLLATLATIALDIARSEHVQSPGHVWVVTALCWMLALGARYGAQRVGRQNQAAAGLAVFLILLMAGLPFVLEWSGRNFFAAGESPELVQLAALRNLMLALAAAAVWPSALRLSCVASLFVALGALMFLYSWLGFVVIGTYGLVGVWWLMGANWERLHGNLVANNRREWPVLAGSSSIALVSIVSLITALAVSGSSVGFNLLELFWGSGGSRWDDSYAARGVGNGDQLVAAKDQANSFGAVESELFLDSEMPSLYDAFNDLYGDEIRRTIDQHRSIALSPVSMPLTHQHASQDQQAGREFSTIRRKRRNEQTAAKTKSSAALIYVAGRVPLHLRLETFDAFDGRVWSRAKPSQMLPVELALEIREDKPWILIPRQAESPALRTSERHLVKIIRLATNRIPSPMHLEGASIDFVDDAHFYGWTPDDVLSLPQRTSIPSLQVIHLESRSFDPALLRTDNPKPAASSVKVNDRVSELAREWTKGLPAGYEQAAAIVERLRSGEFTLDPDYVVPPDCEQAAEHFLFESRRGPDYLFATSATLLLRSLGYPARVATGLYARSERYERLQRQTAVLAEDVHFWSEIQLDGATWFTLEPTPGYAVLPPLRTWSESAVVAAHNSWIWVVRHPVHCVFGLALLICIVRSWRELLDYCLTFIWLLRCRLAPGSQLLATLWLIEHRARLAGKRRPEHVTLSRWYQPLAGNTSLPATKVVQTLLQEWSVALYAPRATTAIAPSANSRHSDLCRQAAKVVSLKVLLAAHAPAT